MLTLPATLMRGGTSKCWIFSRSDLDQIDAPLDNILLRLFGSPDERQIDGIGGGTSTTSKAVILSPSTREGVDVDYTFAQVGLADGRVDWASNCGNCSSAVAPFALHRGWVSPCGERTPVRIFNTNTGQLIVAEVPTPGGHDSEQGESMTPGVPYPGTEVELWFVDPSGRTTGHLLPSGAAVDEIDGVQATLIDAGAPVAIVQASSLGLTGDETPTVIDAQPDLLARLEIIRREAAVRMGLAAAAENAAKAVPKLALVSPPRHSDHDFRVTMMSMGKTHPALAVTGSIALSLAAVTPGTLLHSDGPSTGQRETISMLTPSGIVTTRLRARHGRPEIGLIRSARVIADADVAVPVEQLIDPGASTHSKTVLVA